MPSTTTRRTLTFPTSETRPTQPAPPRSKQPLSLIPSEDDDYEANDALNATLAQLRDSERALDAPGLPKDLIVTPELLPTTSSSSSYSSDDSNWDDEDGRSPSERPSERSTVPTLSGRSKGVTAVESSDPIIRPIPLLPEPPVTATPATAGVVEAMAAFASSPPPPEVTDELSASELHTDRELPLPPLSVRKPVRDRLPSTMPPPLPAQWKWRREVSLHTLVGRGETAASKAEVLELELEDDGETSYPIELSRVSRPAPAELDELHDHHDPDASPESVNPAKVKTARPPHSASRFSKLARMLAPLAKARRVVPLVPLVASHLALAATVAFIVGSPHKSAASIAKDPREPRAAASDRTPLVSPAAETVPFPLSGACTTSGASRILASRAQIGPGLEVSVLETGFGVALASGAMEAVGLRVEGSSGLRVAETVRVKHPMAVHHVTVDGHDDDADGIDVRVDSDEARTVVGAGDAPPFRVVARGGYVMALLDDPRGARIRTLWPVPGARVAPVVPTPAPAAAAPAPAGKASPYQPPGFSKLPDTPRPTAHTPMGFANFANEVVRASGRDDGGAVVALRRPSTLWLGVTDGALAPAGALVALTRKNATVGTPAVTQWGGGGAVAWAERAQGEREWNIVVAGFTPDGESGATHLGPVRVIAKGMSPSLATLPDGDLLLALADGAPGAHRVVALRLNRDLEPRGEPVVVSPESVNAGQPVAAVRADGRGIVAFFAASIGRSASVFATPLACDPGL